MAHPLEDSYDKLDRADEHLESIKGEIRRFLDRNPYGVVTNSYPGSPNKIHLVCTAKVRVDTPRRLRVLIGDFFHNLRASLDQLAYVLATPHSGGPPPPRTEFPVFKDKARFFETTQKGKFKGHGTLRSGLYKMRGMPSGAQTLVKWLQPYRRINDPEGDPLWIIHDMSIGDKHRKAHTTGTVLDESSITIGSGQDVSIHFHQWGTSIRSGPCVDGTTLGTFKVTVTGPNPEVDMHPNLSCEIAFDTKGPARGEPVMAKLTELRDYVRGKVFPKLEPFV